MNKISDRLLVFVFGFCFLFFEVFMSEWYLNHKEIYFLSEMGLNVNNPISCVAFLPT